MTDDDGGHEPRRHRRESGRNSETGRSGRPVRRDRTATPRSDREYTPAAGSDGSAADGPVPGQTGRSAAVAARQVTVETDSVSATLVAIPEVDVRELAYEHRIDRSRLDGDAPTQPVALFDLHNVGRFPITWRSSRTRFIGDDGYSYEPAQLSLDPGQLGPGIHTRRVEIRPDRRARVATLVERLPAGVDVAEAVQTVSVQAAGTETEQLVFSLTG